MTTVREVRLKTRPVGLPTLNDFEIAAVELAAPGPGEVAVKNLFLSVDPYMRGRMYDRPSYVPPFELGKVMQGGAVGEVTASNDPAFKPGDVVSSMFGWREAYVAKAEHVQKIETHGLAPQLFLGAAGMPGMTAYFGLLDVADGCKPGETVFVSAASGAVGSIVCQIAKLKGATVIGSAGGPEKAAFLKEIGCDVAIDYRAGDINAALAAAAPKGIDVYFDNVGGDHLMAAMNAARPFARFAECGMISNYNDATPSPGPTNMALIVGKRLKIRGFIVSDFAARQGEFARDMAQWIASGQIKTRDTVDEGIEAMPGAFLKLFSGGNVGKMLVKV
jgi:NADPH-dependent curcumin reductase CurA